MARGGSRIAANLRIFQPLPSLPRKLCVNRKQHRLTVLAPDCAFDRLLRVRPNVHIPKVLLGSLKAREMRAIMQDHGPVEGQARFRAIPVNELIDSVTITPLCVC